MNNVITFPEDEYNSYKERLDNNLVIYTTRVSSEVGKYKLGCLYDSVFGSLKVVDFKHYDSLDDHPFLNELTDAQKCEIDKYIQEKGFDLIGLEKENNIHKK